MKTAIVFRQMKNTKYSFIPLIASLEKTSYLEEIDLLQMRTMSDLLNWDGKYTELIIAFSFMTFDLDLVLADLAALQNLPLQTPISLIAGGSHVSGDPASGEMLGFDTIFIGDGEATIREYCDDLFHGRRKKIYDATQAPVQLSDYPPFPTEQKKLIMPIEISRGCPFGCHYCAVSYLYGRIPRHRSLEQILEYSRWAFSRNKVLTRFISPNAFGYQSPNGVTPNFHALELLLSGLKELGMPQIYFGTFPSDVRPESVTREVLQLVRKYCSNENLVIGAQSGSNRMLQAMGRGHDRDMVESAIAYTRESGLEPWVDFIFGLPGETLADRKETIAWMEKITSHYGAVIHAHTFMPLVGTPWVHLDPEPVDATTLQFLGRFSQRNLLFGYWARQRKLAERIQQWRKAGFISAVPATPYDPCDKC